jgi:hypothetical protein
VGFSEEYQRVTTPAGRSKSSCAKVEAAARERVARVVARRGMGLFLPDSVRL